MQTGLRGFTVYVTNLGVATPGITGGWQYSGSVTTLGVGQELNFSGVTTYQSSGAGFYVHSINLPVGDGYVQIKNSNPAYNISPNFFQFNDVENYDNDSIFAKFLNSANVNVTKFALDNQIYESYANDDFIQDFTISSSVLPANYGGNGTDLTGWTLNVASTTVPISGSIVTTSAINRLTTVTIAKTQLPSSLITTGESVNLQLQIQGTSPTGKRKTVAKFIINLLKDYNTN